MHHFNTGFYRDAKCYDFAVAATILEDLPSGNYIQEDVSRCSYLCEAGQDCCDVMASCKCGTHTGQYDCVCERGYYGKGLQHECTATVQLKVLLFVSLPVENKQILRHSRRNATKVIFLITDGYSNGGDPRPIAASLRDAGVEIFTFGIWQGNIRELHDMASHSKEEHCYLVHNFAEFEALARRALHEDLPSGNYIQEDVSRCSYLCEAGQDCCDVMASCKCGTHTGQYDCVCERGYYGKGLQHECTACPSGTYKPESTPGGMGSCIPCPDKHHTSPPGSTTVEDCVCKDGYSAAGQSCEACPSGTYKPESTPGGMGSCIPCPDKHHTSPPGSTTVEDCVCKDGYSAAGQSCEACPSGTYKPESTPGGMGSCIPCPDKHHTSPPGSTTVEDCVCKDGYSAAGQSCEVVHCPEIQPPENGFFIQNVCNNHFNAACGIRCKLGFDLVGSSIRLCQPSGEWSGSEPTCRDTEPPQINCPKDIVTETMEHQSSASISWIIPNARDNSGEEVSIQVTPTFIPPHPFPIGEVKITYTATDRSGNRDSCSFIVKVIGAPLTITESHSPGDLFPRGETVVHYTATDPSGNNRTCDIHVIIRGSACEQPFNPVNGEFSCTEEESGVNCTLYCMDGYGFTDEPTHSYLCAHDGVPSFCSDDDVACRLEVMPQGQCLEYNYDYDNGFAIGPGGWGQNWGAQGRLDYAYPELQNDQPDTNKPFTVSPKMAPLRRKRHRQKAAPATDQKIHIVFNITASIPLPAEQNNSLEAENQKKLLLALENITNRLKRTLNKEPLYTFQVASEMIVADTKSLESEKAALFCRPGSVLKGRMCDRVQSYEEGTFHADGGILFCSTCNVSLDHLRKGTIDKHLDSAVHKNKKNKLAVQAKQLSSKQVTITRLFKKSTESGATRNVNTFELVEAFSAANIPCLTVTHSGREYLYAAYEEH
ncbi:UNVERIFIED_CONTAM: hypothetical protein FKN15_073951 [Acipenser sinensis]